MRQPTILGYLVRDSALLGLDACAARNNAGIDARTIVAQAHNAIVRSVRPDTLGFRRHLKKVPAALSAASGAVPLQSCEGPLVARSRPFIPPTDLAPDKKRDDVLGWAPRFVRNFAYLSWDQLADGRLSLEEIRTPPGLPSSLCSTIDPTRSNYHFSPASF